MRDRKAAELLVGSFADLLLDAAEHGAAKQPADGPAVTYGATVRSATGLGLNCATFDRAVFSAWLASAVLTLAADGVPGAQHVTIDVYGPRNLQVTVDGPERAAQWVKHLADFR